MAAPYTYISSADYINSLQFDYIETYSLQRGAGYYEGSRIKLAQYFDLQKRKNNQGLSPEEEEVYTDLCKRVGATQYLLDADGQFHPSAVKSNTFYKDASEVDQLVTILQNPVIDMMNWMCAPVYRDAVVFFNAAGNIMSTLNICLGCEYMETKMFNHVNADVKTYALLREFFTVIGHNLENDKIQVT